MNYLQTLNICKKNSFELLTDENSFENCNRTIRVKCSKGHTSEILAEVLRIQLKCLSCNSKKRNTIEDMKQIAIERGGECLSDNYVHSESKLEWRCSEGHTWWSNAHTIKKGSWCPKCKNESQKNDIWYMHFWAAFNNGKCLSKEYVLNNVPLKWQCSKGHKWMAQPTNIVSGEWCPHCNLNRQKLTIEEMQKIARSRGGECLSKKYVKLSDKLKWKCAKGHVWEACARNVKHSNSWCPICYKLRS
jgi:hypothetical protein